ncbi:GSCOCG00002317001-RA-CDS [Cotesia congregata]|nr:GSCOCG00002317001-RA-CDS [Cotesia congregata]
MFYWIISAALIASALATPYGEPPCSWAILCNPNMIDTSGNDLITIKTQHTIPMAVNPVDDCDDSKTAISTTSTKTSSGSSDFSQMAGDFIDYFSQISTKTVPPATTTTTTTTEAPKRQFSEAEMAMMFKSFMKYYKEHLRRTEAPSTTTTEAPETKIHKNGMVVETETLGGYTNSFGSSQKTAGKIAGENKFGSVDWKKVFASRPELEEENSAYHRKSHTVSHPHSGPFDTETPKKQEPYDEKIKQIVQKTEHFIPVAAPTTTIAPAPASSSSTIVKTISGSRGVGHTIEHKSSKSSESSSSSFTQFTYGNAPIGYKMTSGEKMYKVPYISSADLNHVTTKEEKFPTFKYNPCEFTTGVFRHFPCDNLLSEETVVQKSYPIVKSDQKYSFKGSLGFPDTNTEFEIKKAVDC